MIRKNHFRAAAVLLCGALLLSSLGTASCGVSEETAPATAASGDSGAAAAQQSEAEPSSDAESSARREIIVDSPVEKETSGAADSSSPAGSGETASGTTESGGSGAVADAASGSVRLAFCGDIYLSNYVLNAYDAGGVNGILDQRLLDAGRNADLFIANEEFPFGTTGEAAPDKQFTFRVDPSRCRILKEIGVDLVSLANNHTLDYGRDCLAETFDTLDRNGIDYMGAGADLNRASRLMTYEINGMKLGFLAASRVIPEYSWNASETQSGLLTAYDPTALLSAVRAAEKQCDFTAVYLHWGIERNTEPEAYQTELAKQLADAGADLVIGSHPHVLQPIRFDHGVPVVYSLGNYLFGSSIPSTELLLADVAEDGSVSLSVIPASGSSGKTVSTGEAEPVTPDS